MRDTTLPSYLYTQYADDDDLQAFVKAYNDASQTYVDWFNEIGLPYYPGLTGDLLTWVVQGLYGLPKTQLASARSPSQGPFNTVPFNTLVFNGFVPSVQTFYNLTDDVFQRILTWDFFKGDGKRFSIRWLKRRIIRFLVGTNGIDPEPSQDGFVMGAETTSAIGVAIASNTVTVSINQTLLSLQADIAPNILTLFKLAFEGGNLDLPVLYTYVCNIVTGLVALARPNALVSATHATAQTTGLTGVTVLGGTGIYTYAWTWQSGGAGINIDSPSTANTTFTAPTIGRGQTLTGVAICTVTDTVSSLTAIATCTVSITCVIAPAIESEARVPITAENGAVPILAEG